MAGRLGGRRIATPPGSATRPTSERAREALFSALGDIEGSRVLDLFAGSGALGLEALSRGAGHVVLVEHDRAAAGVLQSNLSTLGLDADEAVVRRGEALRTLGSARSAGETYDLVFVDPPYRRAVDLAVSLTRSLPPVLAPGARVVCESDRRAPLELALPVIRRRRYGDTLIIFHRSPAADHRSPAGATP